MDDIQVMKGGEGAEQFFLDLSGRVQTRISRHERDPASPAPEIRLWRGGRIGGRNADIFHLQPQFFRQDLLHDGVASLSDVGSHGQQVNGSV